jgi:hypothetical protein
VPNRTICSVFEEMRKLNKARNYSSLLGLIEEAQSMANRMESALYDRHDLKRAREEYKEIRKEIEKLEEKKRELKEGGK